MTLAAGTRVGPYEIISVLGVGGMGEVYRARDPILNRDIALKILPDLFAVDRDRVARFKREAQVLASLNHPHIAAIYGFEDVQGLHALALELVDGPTLADRLAQGPIPIDDAIPIARQIAEALEAAHEQGIVHRDLKPANIKVRLDGTVKVLDFGLAKTIEPLASTTGDVTASPTITSPAMTQMGLILGTAAYMSPEQARGHVADKRSDVWSFGVVLHEMLSGQRTFTGDDIADTLASVLRQEINMNVLPAHTPAPIRHLITRCLERNAKQRLRDIGEARILLNQPTAPLSSQHNVAQRASRNYRWLLTLAVVAASIGAIAAIAAWQFTPRPALPVTRFPFMLPAGQTYASTGGFGRSLAISPDGSQMVYVAAPRPQLHLRSMSELEGKPIVGTDLYDVVSEPAFSPDGRSIAFFALGDRTLKRIAVTGGTAVTICPIDSGTSGLSWGPGGIVFGTIDGRIMRVSPDGGSPETLVRAREGEAVYGPELLPDGQHMLFTIATGTARDRWDKARIVVQSIASGEPKTLIDGGSDARYVPTGHLVYALSGIVYAVAFDLKRLEVYGPRVPVIQGVRRSPSGLNGAVNFSISNTGSLTYIPGPLSPRYRNISLSDRNGGFALLKLEPGDYFSPRMAPDGRRLVFATDDGKEANVYTHDLDDNPPRRLTYEGNNRFPIWSGDGARVAFQSDRQGDFGIWWQPAVGGTAERLTKAEPGTSHTPESWSPKGDVFLYSVTKGSDVSLRMHSLADKSDLPFGDVHSSTPTDATFSPNGRWVAYTSADASKTTVYVQPYPPTGDKFQLAAKGAENPHEPAWSPDGTELFYSAAPGRFEVVGIRTTPAFAFGNPAPVAKWRFANSPPWQRRGYDISPTGQFLGFLVAGQEDTALTSARVILFVLNWHEELKRLVPTK